MVIVFYVTQKTNPSFTYEVIIVDDGSKDKTTQVCFTIFSCKILTQVHLTTVYSCYFIRHA